MRHLRKIKVGSVWLCSLNAISQTTPESPSGGRVESPGKGLSDMDVARAATGQGWPFAACPWSGDGTREPRRSRGRMVGCPSLWLLSLGQARESDSPVRGETHTARRRANGECQVIGSEHLFASPVSSVSSPGKCDEPLKRGAPVKVRPFSDRGRAISERASSPRACAPAHRARRQQPRPRQWR